ncbi:hypothetical protein [Streptomyces sp. NPDC101150]|uniref:hypothetical protein n=1 Tax=Streptomyces sp. NPDC101150 TaxID=3366114 RepID=UPI003800E3E4
MKGYQVPYKVPQRAHCVVEVAVPLCGGAYPPPGPVPLGLGVHHAEEALKS